MSQHECKRCGETKGGEEMCQRGGKPSRLCKVCFAASFAKKSGGGKAVTKRKAKAVAAPEPVKLNGHLEVAAGLGFRASLEDAQLVIEQDRQEDETIYTHQVTLSPSEARALVDWIAERVAA